MDFPVWIQLNQNAKVYLYAGANSRLMKFGMTSKAIMLYRESR